MSTDPTSITRMSTGADALLDQAKRLHLAETLVEVSRTTAALDSLDDVLASLVAMTAAALRAERATLFLNDTTTNELYSRSMTEHGPREIRMLNDKGIAGKVFQTGQGIVVQDAYAHPDFNPEVDATTGYDTRQIVCAPIRTGRGELIGVAQVLNRIDGHFDDDDLQLLEAMTTQAALALTSGQRDERSRVQAAKEMEFVDLVADITSEIDLDALLLRVMTEATAMLDAERSTLFLHDARASELVARVAEGNDGVNEIRFPDSVGIAGTVFTSGETINIPHAYADLRFNPSFDAQTGFFTRSILCVPLVNKDGETIGATQALNKRGGPFTAEDEQRLRAFTAQVAIALENAKLFDDVQRVKNYNDAVLESMTNGVVTLDNEGQVVTCNAAGAEILGYQEQEIVGRSVHDLFSKNPGILALVEDVMATSESRLLMDVDIDCGIDERAEAVSVNVTGVPLRIDTGDEGTILLLENISSEKRVRSTMARYMDPALADRLVRSGEDILGGTSAVVSLLFSDIRGFTSLTEQLGPQATVSMLNEYFTLMVDCIQSEGGMLDKFIGDAIMAAFGLPTPDSDDPDRAVRTAIAMIRSLHGWNSVRSADGKPTIDMGIGVNTGAVVAGNIGSPKRMDFTMIGDGVNLAARLESACKQYDARILISDFTHQQLNGVYRTREIDRVVVKGKTEPVAIHEVLDYHTNETFPNLMDVVNDFRDGVDNYRRGAWDAAIGSFRRCLQAHPGDSLSAIYIERCEQLRTHPPENWDGIWVMTSK
ncbi:MAG TPA: GAF domain-containing protein [Ilumatobacteraceae bacterium]|nr:GAF domain-containing protein [Ilumatobacteraceae bacterium]